MRSREEMPPSAGRGHRSVRVGLSILALAFPILPQAGAGEDLDLKKLFQQGIPVSPFSKAFYGYGDVAVERGGEVFGPSIQDDENLIRLLYFLMDLSGQERYSKAADDALRRFLEGAGSPEGLEKALQDFSRPWLLWERCFELSLEASRRIALESWRRHAAGGERSAQESPRRIGFRIRTWAEAHARTGDPVFLEAIAAALRGVEEIRGKDPGSRLSFAIDCDGAARKVPEPLRTRLALRAAQEDDLFCTSPDPLKLLPLWQPDDAGSTLAKVAMMCVARYENAGDARYRGLILAAADAYRDSSPDAGSDARPMTFGHAISLELAAFRASSKEAYFQSATRLGQAAMEGFFGGRALPRSSLKSDRYDSAAGADTLALALVDLHLTTMTITAVRAPANTIDR